MVSDEQVSIWLRALEKSNLWCWIIEYIDRKELISYWHSPHSSTAKLLSATLFPESISMLDKGLCFQPAQGGMDGRKRQHPASWAKGFLTSTVWTSTGDGKLFSFSHLLTKSKLGDSHCWALPGGPPQDGGGGGIFGKVMVGVQAMATGHRKDKVCACFFRSAKKHTNPHVYGQ